MTAHDHLHFFHDIKIDVGQRIHDHRVVHGHAVKGIDVASDCGAVDGGCPPIGLLLRDGSRSDIDDVVEVSGHGDVLQQISVHNHSNFRLLYINHRGGGNNRNFFFDRGYLHGDIDGSDHPDTDYDFSSNYSLESRQFSLERVVAGR